VRVTGPEKQRRDAERNGETKRESRIHR
jgi:hypothetical protein